MNENTKSLIRLSMVPDVGQVRLKHLLDYFGSGERIFEAGEDELKNVPGINPRLAHRIVECRNSKDAEDELKKIEDAGVSVLSVCDEGYPFNLRSIFDPPVILYVRGKILREDNFAVSVVGTRQMSAYGKMAAAMLARDLAKKKITVVSGLARGIDSVAHRETLSAGGRTVAVLGCGVDVCYPAENRKLYEEIPRHGALISEFHMSFKPDRGNFPMRNRIISGLSLGTVVIEAGEKSGALITADMALEQGREVFAVPGSIFNPKAKGTHSLIRQGAKLTESYDDILEEIELLKDMTFPVSAAETDGKLAGSPLDKDEEKIYNTMSREPMHIDLISERSNMPVSRTSSLLLGLEMKGRIKEISGKMFVRTDGAEGT